MKTPEHSSSDSAQHVARYEFAKQFVKDKMVIDIACGDGYGVRALAHVAKSVVGVDNDEYLISLANNFLSSLGNVRFSLGDALKIPAPDDSTDVVTSMETIEHFTAQDSFLRELKRVTRDGGTIIMSTPDADANRKMGTYHDRSRKGHGHPGEMTFAQFFYLMHRHFDEVKFFGQLFLEHEPGVLHKAVNLAKRLDVFNLRRILGKGTRDKYNVSAHLTDLHNVEIRKLDRQAVDVIAVAINRK